MEKEIVSYLMSYPETKFDVWELSEIFKLKPKLMERKLLQLTMKYKNLYCLKTQGKIVFWFDEKGFKNKKDLKAKK